MNNNIRAVAYTRYTVNGWTWFATGAAALMQGAAMPASGATRQAGT
ncbi:hypothetical protein AAGS40_07460 [Paraburkholderia sp. PREW-6R]